MRLWNGLTPHSIVKYEGKMFKIKELYVIDEKKYADLVDAGETELKQIDITKLEKVDD